MASRSEVRPLLFALSLGVLATVLAVQALWLTYAAQDFLSHVPKAAEAFAKAGIEGKGVGLALSVGVLAAAVLVASIMALVRRGWVLRYIQAVGIAGYAVVVYAVHCLTTAVAAYGDTGLPFQGLGTDRARVAYFLMQCGVLKWVVPALAGFVLIHVVAARRSTINLYTGETGDDPAFFDRLLEDLRAGGKDPEFRKCWLMSLGTHAAAIFLVPLLLQLNGCATRKYNPPPVSNDSPKPTPVKIIKRPKIKLPIYNENSPIVILRWMDFRVSDVFDQVRTATELQYTADPSRVFARSGRGKNNNDGYGSGWPGGKGSGKVKFFRLSYNGERWNDGMDSRQPSANFLGVLGRTFNDIKIDYREEAVPIKALKDFVKGYAPPVVYMTGEGRIDVSEAEVKTLRQYLQDGGMLFADSGAPAFQQAFCVLMSRVMPEDRLVNLPDDEEVFRAWFQFPNGAPPIWPHGGDRAMGVRHKGRLCVFFHPGDLNDAWKTGHSGLTPDRAELAFQMGINVFYYAFKQYAAVAEKNRK